eukprot:scaffold27646_cov106-Skeletonema_marinoi.AAC.1
MCRSFRRLQLPAELLRWLLEAGKGKKSYAKWPTVDGHKIVSPGKWVRLVPSYCSSGAIEVEVEEIVLRAGIVSASFSSFAFLVAHKTRDTSSGTRAAASRAAATNSNSYLPLVGRSGLTFPNTCTANEENDADAGSGRKTTYIQ